MSAKTPLASLLWRSLRVYQVFGANTEVGKTVFTTLLCKTAGKAGERVAFLKPVSTGAADDADDSHILKFASNASRRTLFQYDIPVSPHAAAKASGRTIPSDDALVAACRAHAAQCANDGGWLFVETAGGVHSPGPSGTTQAELYTPLRVPVVLIGDAKLGGISQTISAFESLRLRGYDVEAVMLFQDSTYENYLYLTEYFQSRYNIPVTSLPEPPTRDEDARADAQAMERYYSNKGSQALTSQVLQHLSRRHEERIESLQSMAAKAHQKIWYPFTQQKLVEPENITTIDSAYGDFFQTVNPTTTTTTSQTALLRASFDGSASWWTQGLGHANSKLTLAAAYAAGRYGHVMFAGAIHQPAMELAETLLDGMQNPRLSRVFYSDNGSTGTEVAVKMGLRAARLRYGWGTGEKIAVLGLKGGYHGDTVGAMDCSEPCIYNEKAEWYEGRGFWFDYPTILCSNGKWNVSVPDEFASDAKAEEFASLNDIFDVEGREQSGKHQRYEEYIVRTLKELQKQGRKFGALIVEPIVLGAGGMAFVDPLFQRTLVNVIRNSPHLFATQTPSAPTTQTDWSGLPIIFDEVFTGLYRLGRFTPSSFLGVHPDISVHAKLLTGGLVPLCTTLASESIFDVFGSEDKTDALLHGHSYTAHPIGCQVALESLREFKEMDEGGNWDWAKTNGWVSLTSAQNDGVSEKSSVTTQEVWSTWPRELVENLSRQTNRVSGVWALGSVLAVHLRDESGSGYGSNVAAGLRDYLGRGEDASANGPWNIHARVLGNVIYLMASQTTTAESVAQISGLLQRGLDV